MDHVSNGIRILEFFSHTIEARHVGVISYLHNIDCSLHAGTVIGRGEQLSGNMKTVRFRVSLDHTK